MLILLFSNVSQARLEQVFFQCPLHIYLLVIFFSECRLGIFCCIKISSHQVSSKPTSFKCQHFCFPFDSHNYGPSCRESGKGDDPCVTNLSPCNICSNFTEQQQTKIKHRRRYTRKQKSSNINTTKDNLNLLGDDEESFTVTQADLGGAAENLFSSPPRPQPLRFESLSLKTPHNVPPTPGTALQNKIESRLEKSLGS